ncbi:MAG: ribosome-associated translation inhibitor RaiA [Helicobacteraceae bacterium]|nr:ribosome-associated translation inhibitor RaiA [Helicobacteraceae bacterium]
MNVQINSKEITLNDHIREHVSCAIENFKKFNLDITTVNVHIGTEGKEANVEFDIHIGHNSPVIISQNHDDLDTAIDLAIGRASKALRRLHTKVTGHKGGESIKNLAVEGEDEDE